MKKPSSKFIIIGVCLFVLIATLAALFFSIKIAVPDVTGKSLSQSTKLFKKNTFRIEAVKEYHDTVPEDVVFWQEHTPGERLRIGSRVTVKVSKGMEPIEVPNVKKKTVDEAKEALTKLEFTVKVTEVFDDELKKGTVISQSPVGGKEIPKGSEVEIVVSKGSDLVPVPDITGMSLEAAKKAVQDAGLRFETDIQCSDTVAEGQIVSQDIEAGTMAQRNATVLAYVSAGVANTVGNTPSNSNQWGFVATQGNWVYYCNRDYNHYLYKMRTDGSEKQILNTATSLGINVVGEWIYFTCEDRNGDTGLYKMRLDGSKKTKLSSDVNYFVHVAGDWIYTAKSIMGSNIYRMRTDGSEKTLVCSDSCADINILGDWIYYTQSGNGAMYKIRTDGSEKTSLHYTFKARSMAVDGNTVVATESYNFLKMNTDKSGLMMYKDNKKQKSYLNATDGWVYFLEHDFSTPGATKSAFYKMRFDTSEKTKILDIKFQNSANYFINVAGDWLYFPNEEDHGYLYRVKTDGTNLQKVYQ